MIQRSDNPVTIKIYYKDGTDETIDNVVVLHDTGEGEKRLYCGEDTDADGLDDKDHNINLDTVKKWTAE